LNFERTTLDGVVRIVPDRNSDARGYFERIYCERTFSSRGLCSRFVQQAISHNLKRGTLRGLHFQSSPYAEIKLVRCVRGKVFDVIVDVRLGSSMFGRWIGVDLSAEGGEMLYIAEGLAHGYITLTDDVTLHYCLSTEFAPDASRGIRWDDPDLKITWPIAPAVISDRDRLLPTFAQFRCR
jgi:dTDP-4-dehydrorhamnose 3,5-epimerase